ncbi:hypothetical protein F4808DRAFT_460387 [Astrocystis sublimbata]|nr:hypothetical protein F4808DRAFT_460387 [Astrocystis sublimbata]
MSASYWVSGAALDAVAACRSCPTLHGPRTYSTYTSANFFIIISFININITRYTSYIIPLATKNTQLEHLDTFTGTNIASVQYRPTILLRLQPYHQANNDTMCTRQIIRYNCKHADDIGVAQCPLGPRCNSITTEERINYGPCDNCAK